MLDRLVDFFTSLKLTAVLLCAAAVLVFIGTIAQVDLGLYAAQNLFFRSFIVWWGPAGADWKIPVFPGGYLVGGLLLINLLAAQITRYKLIWSKLGLHLVHIGLVVLLLGQLATDLLQVETFLRLTEGEAKSYSETSRVNELVLMDVTDPNFDRVVSIPETLLAKRLEIRAAPLPFTLRVRAYYRNAEPQFRGRESDGPTTTNGLGAHLNFGSLPPVTRMDSRDVPAALVEVVAGDRPLGSWWGANWLTEPSLVDVIARQARDPLRQALVNPQQFTYNQRTYQLGMRPMRFYKPFNLRLVKFTHKKYSGTEIPKDFSSLVRVQNPATGEDREVRIYMNNPLRYGGETFYQSGYDENDPRVTILQVVRNPSWLTPYVACVLVSVGLIWQFLLHLIGFARERRSA